MTLSVWSHYKLLQVNKIFSYSVLHLKKKVNKSEAPAAYDDDMAVDYVDLFLNAYLS